MELTRSDGNTALPGRYATKPNSKVSYSAGAMLAVAAVRPGARRVGEDVPLPEEVGRWDGWCTNCDRGW
jgi:hypothetical protein